MEEITIPRELLIDKESQILNMREFQIKLAYAVTSKNFGLVEACLQTAKEKVEQLEADSRRK